MKGPKPKILLPALRFPNFPKSLVLLLPLLFLSLLSHRTAGQALTTQNQAWLSRMDSTLTLSKEQHQSISNILLTYQHRADSLQAEIKHLEKSETDEALLQKTVSELRNTQKNLRSEQSEAIRVTLDERQQQAFDQMMKPAKPAVLHFGLHNRADCNVCK